MTLTLRLGLLRSGLELRQFFRGRESVIFSFALPILLLIVFGSVFGGVDIAPGVTQTQYFVAGMIAAAQLINGFQTLSIQIPMERDRGVLKRLYGMPMPAGSYFIGKIAMVYLVGVGSCAIMLAIATAFFDVTLPSTGKQWFTLVWVSLLGIAACTLCGIAFSSIPREAKRAPAVVTPVALVLEFISGVFFVFTDLPAWMQQVAAVFPLKWMAQGMRSVFLPESFAAQEVAGSWQLGATALVLAGWTVVGLLITLRTFRWLRRDAG
jgi:ABC-2 type transport system permease protein